MIKFPLPKYFFLGCYQNVLFTFKVVVPISDSLIKNPSQEFSVSCILVDCVWSQVCKQD